MENRQKNEIMKLPPANVAKYGGRKSIFTNCKKICNKINRTVDHLFKVICSELSTDGSINGEQQIILKGKFYSKHINKILAKYINKYVKCDVCNSLKTNMVTEKSINYLDCMTCLARQSIIY